VTEVESFIGREQELSEIGAVFADGPTKRKIVVLFGLGGIGKTQLAATYAKRRSADYLAVIWLQGNDVDSLEQGFAHAAQRLRDEHPTSTALAAMLELPNAAETARAMIRWLSTSSNRQWLLIFDNVDNVKLPNNPDGAYDLRPYLPVAAHGHIMVTTRLSELDVGRRIAVKQLTDVGESLAILAATSQRAIAPNGWWTNPLRRRSLTIGRSRGGKAGAEAGWSTAGAIDGRRLAPPDVNELCGLSSELRTIVAESARLIAYSAQLSRSDLADHVGPIVGSGDQSKPFGNGVVSTMGLL
jgi:AAA ATPase domain